MKNKDLILKVLTLANKGKEGHVPSSLSILDILDTLYGRFIAKKKLDKFVLSKGHGCLSFYAVLEKYKIRQKDVMIIFSNSGVNHVPVEAALIAKKKKIKT